MLEGTGKEFRGDRSAAPPPADPSNRIKNHDYGESQCTQPLSGFEREQRLVLANLVVRRVFRRGGTDIKLIEACTEFVRRARLRLLS